MQPHSDDLLLAGIDQAGMGDGSGLALAPGAADAAAAPATPSAAQALDPTAHPYDTVVRITADFGGQAFQGSGVLIAPDEVLTASHVVYAGGLGTATSLDVVPAYSSGAMPYGHAAGTVAHYSQIGNGQSIYRAEAQSDYAIIHLSNYPSHLPASAPWASSRISRAGLSMSPGILAPPAARWWTARNP